MKKRILILTTLFLSLTGFAQTFIDGNFTYEVATGDTVILSDYNISGGTDVVIPATVSYNSMTYNVGYIGYQSFQSKGITSVIIPNSVVLINNAAFIFNDLTTVIIPNSVKIIGGGAFGSNMLSSVSIGDNVTFIGQNAFNGNQLTDFTLPVGVTAITKQVFANNNITDVVIPEGIISIGEGAFSGNPLSSVTSWSLTPPDIFTALGIADSFAEDRSDIDLIIPAGTMAPYVTDAGAEWTGFKSVTEATVGIQNSHIGGELSIFPNPVTSQLFIDIDEGIQSLEIIDVSGKTIRKNYSSTAIVDVSDLVSGVYYLQIV